MSATHDITDVLRSLKKYVSIILPDYEVRLTREEGAFRRPFVGITTSGGFSMSGHQSADYAEIVQPFQLTFFPERGTSNDDGLMKALALQQTLHDAFRYVGAGSLTPPTGVSVSYEPGDGVAPGTYVYAVSLLSAWKGETLATEADGVTVTEASLVTVSWDAADNVRGFNVYRDGGLVHVAGPDETEWVDRGAQATAGDAPTQNTTRLGWPLRVPLWNFTDVPLTETSTVRSPLEHAKVTDFSTSHGQDDDDPWCFVVHADLRLVWRRASKEVSGGQVVESVGIDEFDVR